MHGRIYLRGYDKTLAQNIMFYLLQPEEYLY